MNYVLYILICFCIYAVLAISMNLVVGGCGLLSLAHASFFAIGAYTYAILSINFQMDLVLSAVIVLVVVAFFSLILSLQSWRLKGDFFVLGSLAVQALVYNSIRNWFSEAPPGTLSNLTNGSHGLSINFKPVAIGIQLGTYGRLFVIAVVLFCVAFFIFSSLDSSAWGRTIVAMRDDELSARGLGKDTRLLKVQAIMFSSVFASFAGVLYACLISYVDPLRGALDESILFLSMVLIGGAGNMKGPIIGALTLLLLREILGLTPISETLVADLRTLAYGLLLIIIVRFRPQGIAGNYKLE